MPEVKGLDNAATHTALLPRSDHFFPWGRGINIVGEEIADGSGGQDAYQVGACRFIIVLWICIAFNVWSIQ